MRDLDRYKDHGRNDPLSDPQRRQHPYDFVSLPDRPAPIPPARSRAVPHDHYPSDRLTGILTLTYETLTPLHVGSGVFETADQCGLAGGSQPVRGILRRLGLPVLPGSSWKGAVRARFEAVTRSRLGVQTRLSPVEPVKLPRELRPNRERGKVRIEISDPRMQSLQPSRVSSPGHLAGLSPADSLFGAMGYRGRLHAAEGEIVAPPLGQSLSVPPLESPLPHRLAKPGAASIEDNTVTISEVEGRKFYYDGPPLESRSNEGDDRRQVREYVDAVPAGATITIDVLVESVTEAELGALLVCAGHGENVGVLRFGGYKPAGLGKVQLIKADAKLRRGSPTRRGRRPAPEPFDPDQAVGKAFDEGLIDRAALDELHEITTRTRP